MSSKEHSNAAVNPINLEDVLASAFARVAQHACRMGEAHDRMWPHLSDLPELESWKDVGKRYAQDFAVEVMNLNFERMMSNKTEE